MMNKRLFALLGLSLLAATACSEGNPVAPNGTILTVTASPNRIGRTASATITVSGRKPDGNPIAQGTDIFFSTTLGSIVRQLKADNQGSAVATLVGDGRIGTAEVTVSLDGSTGGGGGTGGGGTGGGTGGTGGGTGPSTVTGTNSVTISVQVGSVPTLVVNINPDNLQITQQARVTVIAQNEDGAPVEREVVTLVTNLGTLNPSNPTLNENGVAESTLRAGDQAGTATVRAFVAGISAEATATIRDAIKQLALDADPKTVTSVSAVDIKILASATNSQDQPVAGNSILFSAPIGSFSPANSAITNTTGRAEVTLRLSLDEVQNNSSVTVRAESSGASGTVTITLPGTP